MKTPIDDDDLLKDGEHRRFPMRMLDSVQRSIAQSLSTGGDAPQVMDASGDPLALHRSGYRVPVPNTPLADAVDIAEAQCVTLDAMRYGTPPTRQVLSLADARARNDKARADHIAALNDAWRSPPPKSAA